MNVITLADSLLQTITALEELIGKIIIRMYPSPQRWLLIKSNHAKVREEHILNKVVTKSTESSLKSFNRLCRKAFSCEADAQKAIEEWQKEQEFTTLSDVRVIEEKQHAKRGRPGLDAAYVSQL